jgi:hypothetical protein
MNFNFIPFLKHLGTDIEHGFERLEPLLPAIDSIVTAINPAIGVLFAATANVVVEVEQKFAAIAKDQSATGPQKLAQVVKILGPVIGSYLQTTDQTEIQAWVNRIVALLNAIPIPVTHPPTS